MTDTSLALDLAYAVVLVVLVWIGRWELVELLMGD